MTRPLARERRSRERISCSAVVCRADRDTAEFVVGFQHGIGVVHGAARAAAVLRTTRTPLSGQSDDWIATLPFQLLLLW